MENIKIEDIVKLFEQLKQTRVARKGYIMLPSIDGFELYEIDEGRLKNYLVIEDMNNKLKENHKEFAVDINEFKLDLEPGNLEYKNPGEFKGIYNQHKDPIDPETLDNTLGING
jgi:hypothetical protein